MAIVFASCEAENFTVIDAANVIGSSQDSGHDPTDTNFTREGLQVSANAGLQADLAASETELWVHSRWAFESDTTIADNYVIDVIDSGNPTNAVVRVDANNANVRLQYWDGAAFQTVGTEFDSTSNTVYTIDLHVIMDNVSGVFELYIDGNLHASFSGDTILSTPTSVDRVFWTTYYATASSLQTSSFSEFIVTNSEQTTGWRLAALAPTGNGTNTAFTGDYTAVDEAGPYNDTDFISGASNGDIETFTASNLSATAQNFDVMAVVVAHRTRRGATGPTQVNAVVRVNGTDYHGSLVDPTQAFTPQFEIWHNSPDTAAGWTISEVNNIEIGVRANT